MGGIHLLTHLLGLYVAPAQKDCEQLTFPFFRQKTRIEKCKKENTDNTITAKNNMRKSKYLQGEISQYFFYNAFAKF